MIDKVLNYCRNHIFQCIAIIIALIAAFGFHASNYSYHYDMLIDDYYNGTVLIGAGRFFAPLLNFFTNWMSFAPYWHTVIMAIILFFSGLIFGLIFKEASKDRFTDEAVFVFWIIFSTFPIIMYQLTFPMLSVVLPYFFIGIVIYKLLPFISGQKLELSTIVLSVLLLTLSVDMYESHAAVFLTMFFSVLFISSIYDDKSKGYKHFFNSCFIIVLLLSISIVLDFVISKFICKLFCGTFEFWYGGNTRIAWFEKTLLDGIKWLIRELIARFLIAGVSNYSVFMYDASLVVGLIISLIFTVKKKSFLVFITYCCAAISTLALAFVIGTAPLYRMMQTIPVFVGMLFMLLYSNLTKNAILKTTVISAIFVIALNQTLFINRYTVANYERYQYENNILTDVAKDLSNYPINEKEVLFVYDANWDFPNFEYTPLDLNNPMAKAYKEKMCKFFDLIIPNTTYSRLNERYKNYYPGETYSLLDAEGVADFFNEQFKNQIYVPFNVRYQSRYYCPETYVAFGKAGYTLIPAKEAIDIDDSLYEEICLEYLEMPSYPEDGYIIETPDKIIVKIY